MKSNPQVADAAPRLGVADERGIPVPWPARPNSPQEVVNLAAKFTGASGAALSLEQPSGEIVCVARCGEVAPPLGAVLKPSFGISAVCIRSGAVQRCADAETDPRVDAEVCRRLGIRSLVLLPVRRNGRVCGLLSVYSSSASKFDHRDVAGLKYLQSVTAALADAAETNTQPAPRLIASALPRDASEPETVAPLAEAPAQPPPEFSLAHFRSLLIALAAMMVVLLALTVERYFSMSRSDPRASLPPQAVVRPEAPPHSPRSADANFPTAPPPRVAEKPPAAKTAPRSESGVGHVQAIQWALVSGNTRVTIALDRKVQFTAFRLDRPDRISFDLRNARFAPEARPMTIAVAGAELAGIRSSQFAPDVVRVVLDLNIRAAYSTEFQADPPRLVIDLKSGPPSPKP